MKDHYFAGIFLGNGQLIENFKGSIFGYIGEDGAVKELSIKNGYISTTTSLENIGLICYVNKGFIENCMATDCTISAVNCSNVGTLVGYNIGTVVNCGVNNCSPSNEIGLNAN